MESSWLNWDIKYTEAYISEFTNTRDMEILETGRKKVSKTVKGLDYLADEEWVI